MPDRVWVPWTEKNEAAYTVLRRLFLGSAIVAAVATFSGYWSSRSAGFIYTGIPALLYLVTGLEGISNREAGGFWQSKTKKASGIKES